MPNSQENTVPVTARVPVSVQEILERAAELSGATLNKFIVQAALKEVKKIIEDERLIILSVSDAEKVCKPTGEIDAFIAAVARSRQDNVVTNNIKDFENIPNLQLENWL
ncbi:MAG: DUF1778 domain-containing protein [Rhizonema sp. PD38]|nr:DUF1778 domain-containing protein [Rhizonema sp. PD38]